MRRALGAVLGPVTAPVLVAAGSAASTPVDRGADHSEADPVLRRRARTDS